MDNSRMKDYFDLWFIATTFEHDAGRMREAVVRTFERRNQALPDKLPVGLSDEFAHDKAKNAQWNAFQSRALGTSISLPEVVEKVCTFALPLLLGHGTE